MTHAGFFPAVALAVGLLLTGTAGMAQDILRIPPAPKADFRLKYGNDPLQFGDLRLPQGDGPHPVVVIIHGGFWRAAFDLEHIGHFAAALTARGVATWSLEYRRIGNPGGGWPGTFEDIGRGVDHLRKLAASHRLDLARVVVTGHSAGGHLALWTGARESLRNDQPLYTETPFRPAAVVSLAGVTDLRRAWELRLSNNVVEEFIGGSPSTMSNRYDAASPIELLPLRIPQILIHGNRDANVPIELSERYVVRSRERGEGARLITLDGAGHFEVIDPRTREWDTIAAEILKATGH